MYRQLCNKELSYSTRDTKKVSYNKPKMRTELNTTVKRIYVINVFVLLVMFLLPLFAQLSNGKEVVLSEKVRYDGSDFPLAEFAFVAGGNYSFLLNLSVTPSVRITSIILLSFRIWRVNKAHLTKILLIKQDDLINTPVDIHLVLCSSTVFDKVRC